MNRKEALDVLMQECSRQEKSPADIEKKLTRWGLKEYYPEILTILRNEKFIDDTRYIKAFIHDKVLFNKWGKLKIRFLLVSAKFPEKVIDECLKEFDTSGYKKIVFEELRKKKISFKNLTDYALKAKLLNFGIRRGYEPDLIYDFLGSE